MKQIRVKSIMVPLEEYATVHEDDSLIDAVNALDKAQKDHDTRHYKHRAILVYNSNEKIVGKLSQLDVIKSLEPRYESFGNIRSISLSGLSPEFVKSMMEKHKLWQGDLNVMCKRVVTQKVKEIMYTPTEGEKIEDGATLGEALHIFVVGHHQSLLVTREEEIVGILRLVDAFRLVSESIKTCGT